MSRHDEDIAERFFEWFFDHPVGASIITAAFLAALTSVLWVVPSYFEARAFERATGKSVSTWDAMFVQLRVEGSAGGGS